MAVDLKPTAGMAEAARTGLRLHNEGKSGDGLKPETVRRANIIAAREELTEEHVREMSAWFARHEADRRPGWNKAGEETPGFVAWMLWGGDAARVWSGEKVEQMDSEQGDRSDTMDDTNIERRDWEFADDGGVAVETRADGRTVLSGYAVRYNTTSVDLGGFRETILPGAFDKVLNRQRGKRDVVALFNHDANQLLGRTSSGTLELSSDEKGLRYSVVLPNTELGRTISELTARGDLRGSSFAFTVDQKGQSWAPGEDGVPRRSIREVSGLFDVSVVTHPAYSSSSAAVARRSMEAWMAEQEEVRCSCQHPAKDADESFAADSARAKSMAVRLKAAVLRTMIRGGAGHVRAYCATGPGGGVDPTCGKDGSKGGGGGDGGSGGNSGGGGIPGGGSGPGGLQSPQKKHDVALPKTKSRINIDQADAALKQMGYKLGKGESKVVGKGRVMMYEVTDSTGHTASVTVDELKNMVYDNRK